jgi:hypothetical protein
MVTAILAVQNLLGARHDVWGVNADDEYHEEEGLNSGELGGDLSGLAETQPLVPQAR